MNISKVSAQKAIKVQSSAENEKKETELLSLNLIAQIHDDIILLGSSHKLEKYKILNISLIHNTIITRQKIKKIKIIKEI